MNLYRPAPLDVPAWLMVLADEVGTAILLKRERALRETLEQRGISLPPPDPEGPVH